MPFYWCFFLFESQKVLFSLGGSFLYYADRFKLYSAFCASHTKVPKVLVKGKSLCQQFLLLAMPWKPQPVWESTGSHEERISLGECFMGAGKIF